MSIGIIHDDNANVSESLRGLDSCPGRFGNAFAGVLIGKRYLHKVKISAVQTLTGVLLFALALLLLAGWI